MGGARLGLEKDGPEIGLSWGDGFLSNIIDYSSVVLNFYMRDFSAATRRWGGPMKRDARCLR